MDRILAKAACRTCPTPPWPCSWARRSIRSAGRGGDGEPVRKTPWGEIAWQLGGAASFAAVAGHDREFVEPKGDAIRAMLPKDRPALILMDEIISYASTYRSQGYGDRLYNFIDCLAETARGEANVALVVSIPASELEYTPDDEADQARFKKMLDRLGKAIMMSADTEMAEIIRLRLFEWQGLPDDASKTVNAYADWAIEHATELTGYRRRDGATSGSWRRYPFHPTVLSVFERKWQSLPRFQRTRGVLRLLALWVAANHAEEHRKASAASRCITLGLAPLHVPTSGPHCSSSWAATAWKFRSRPTSSAGPTPTRRGWTGRRTTPRRRRSCTARWRRRSSSSRTAA